MERVSTYGYTDIGNRKENEDTGGIFIYEKNIVAVVADGLGGQGDGKAASELVVRRLSRCGEDDVFPDQQTVSESFLKANREVLKAQKNSFHMKTTAVYLCVQEDRAIWAHVGDSRLYHFWNGELCDYTLDHSIPQVDVALGKITREEIPGHPRRSSLIRALGCEDEEAEVHVQEHLKKGRHGFLLCTDGFWEYVRDEEIQETLRQSVTAEEWIQNMRRIVRKRWESDYDNNTAAAVILEV